MTVWDPRPRNSIYQSVSLGSKSQRLGEIIRTGKEKKSCKVIFTERSRDDLGKEYDYLGVTSPRKNQDYKYLLLFLTSLWGCSLANTNQKPENTVYYYNLCKLSQDSD